MSQDVGAAAVPLKLSRSQCSEFASLSIQTAQGLPPRPA